MQTRILSGRNTAQKIRAEVGEEVVQLQQEGLRPGLAAVLVGDDPASRVYVRSKTRTCEQLGIHSRQIGLPSETSTEELLQIIEGLNADDDIDGILVQLPLPSHIDEARILRAVHPDKDVDGFHPINVGKLCLGRAGLVPCTPMGILRMLDTESIAIRGQRAVVVGRSNIVGKPLALLLLHQHATVTICHSRTQDLPSVCREADLLIAAIGRPGFVTGDFIKPEAVVVDVGINQVRSRQQVIDLFGENPQKLERWKDKGYVLVGDVHPRQVEGRAATVTPVPGGVGPLTIAQLMKNTVLACQLRRGRRLLKGSV